MCTKENKRHKNKEPKRMEKLKTKKWKEKFTWSIRSSEFLFNLIIDHFETSGKFLLHKVGCVFYLIYCLLLLCVWVRLDKYVCIRGGNCYTISCMGRATPCQTNAIHQHDIWCWHFRSIKENKTQITHTHTHTRAHPKWMNVRTAWIKMPSNT